MFFWLETERERPVCACADMYIYSPLPPPHHHHPSYRRGEFVLARFSYARARRTKLRFAGLSSTELSLSMSADCPFESLCSSRSWFCASVRCERGWLDPGLRSCNIFCNWSLIVSFNSSVVSIIMDHVNNEWGVL